MPFNLESHFHLVLEYVLTHERHHFFEAFDIESETQLSDVITNPSVQHVWKSAHIVCRAFEANLITLQGTQL